MVSHLFYYQLAVLVLAWLFVLLHVTGAKLGLPAPLISAQPKRTRSTAPTPFAGLTHRPPWALWERATVHPNPSTPVPPAPMPPTHRRPRTVETSTHFCPHTRCDYRGWRGLHNLRANGHPSGGPWRQLHCTACDGSFPEHHGTIFHGKQVAVERIVCVLACVAEGRGIRATARVFEVDPTTVLQWLDAAVDQLQAFAHSFLCEIHVRQLQVDELYAVPRAMKAGDLSEAEAIRRLSPYWVWTAMDPETKCLLAIDVGTRTLALAQRVAASGGPLPRSGLRSPFSQRGLQGLPARDPHPFWLLGPSRAPPRQRFRPQPTVDAAARAPVCARDQNAAAASTDQGDAPGGLWHSRSGGAGLSRVWLADPDGVCRTPHPDYPPTCRRYWPSRSYGVPGRGRFAAAGRAVSDL
jgi:hypothetical protein